METIVKDFLNANCSLYLKKNFKNAKKSDFMGGVMLTNKDGKTVTVTKQLFTDDVINVEFSDGYSESYLYDQDSKSFKITNDDNSWYRG